MRPTPDYVIGIGMTLLFAAPFGWMLYRGLRIAMRGAEEALRQALDAGA